MTSKTYTASRRNFTPKNPSLFITFIKACILLTTGYATIWAICLVA